VEDLGDVKERVRDRWKRCRQVLRWLEEEWEWHGDPIELVVQDFVPDDDAGDCLGWADTDGNRIYLSRKNIEGPSHAIETLLHEFAHMTLQDEKRGDYHGRRFHIVAGEISDAYEHHGFEDSKAFPQR